METFQPKAPSQLEKFFFHPALHVSLILIAVGLVFLFIREKHREELRNRAELLNSGPVVMQKSTDEIDASNDLAAGSLNEEFPNTPSDQTPESVDNSLSSPASGVASFGNSSETISAGPRSNSQNVYQLTKARMVYLEVDRSVTLSWLREIRSLPGFKSFDSLNMGTLPLISQKLRLAGVRVLQQTDYNIRQPQSVHEWFLGTHKTPDHENEIGFFSSLNINDQQDGLARGDIEIQRALRDLGEAAGKNIERISFGGPFELPKDSGFMMHGLLPPRYAQELDEDSNPDPVLSIFKSRKFLNDETDFIFILDFDSTGPSKQ